MPGRSRRHESSSPRRIRDDAGFALVEVMVSAVLLIVLSLSTLSVIDRAQATSSNNRSRDVAAQLAQSELDAIRQLPMASLAGGFHPGVVTRPVGGIPYTVDSSADWVTDSGGPVTCSTSGRLAYLRSETSITWPGMGSVKPVTADAIVDPGVATLGANKGALTVLLSKADGTGTEGITVTADGVSAVTDANGCAVLGNLDVGQQTLTYSQAGYVDKDSKSAVSKTVTIGAGTIAQASGLYDHPGVINTTFVDDSTPAKPATWPLQVAMDHAQRSTPTVFTTPVDATKSSASTTVFPFSSSYKAYVGNCTGNDPSNTLYTNSGAAPGAQVNPNQTKSVTLTMPNMTLDLVNATDANAATVLITPETGAPAMAPAPPSPACTGTASYTGLTSDVNGKLTIPVPYGVWHVCAYKKVGSTYYSGKTSTWATTTGTAKAIVATTPTTTGNYVARLLTRLPMTTTSSGGPSC
jgi:type II secretory pathway pseudopilin PulG